MASAAPQAGGEAGDKGKSSSKTVTDTITGEHEHTIVGYSLVKGIGDGEPIASERFTVGGHEWVLLFYPDGKRSSSTEGHLNQGVGAPALVPPPPPFPPPAEAGNPPQPPPQQQPPQQAQQQQADGGQPPALPAPPGQAGAAAQPQNAEARAAAANAQRAAALANAHAQAVVGAYAQVAAQHPMHRREQTNDYAALFVALIGESDSPQGVVNTSEGRVVRAFHRFTLVDQTGQGRDLTKGRRRDQGAVKISCARQDPNARNCHGYRKFVKRSVLESVNNGYLVNDTLIIRYTVELVVSSGGALSKQPPQPPRQPGILVPPPSLGCDLAELLDSGEGADVTFRVEGEQLRAHRIVLTTRSMVFAALLNGGMREGKEGVVTVEDVRAPVFRALLHFVYTDALPEEMEGANLDVAMAQHLLVAADRYQLGRLRRICERHLCESVEASTVATTLALAEQNHAEELKRVCLEFVSRNLGAVMGTEGYQHMLSSCPGLQSELLGVIAERGAAERSHRRPRDHNASEGPQEAELRRVRQRRE